MFAFESRERLQKLMYLIKKKTGYKSYESINSFK